MPYRYKGVNFHWNAQVRIRTNLHLAEPTQVSLIDRWATSRPSSPLRANRMSPLVYLQCETNKLERCFSLADGATTWSKWGFGICTLADVTKRNQSAGTSWSGLSPGPDGTAHQPHIRGCGHNLCRRGCTFGTCRDIGISSCIYRPSPKTVSWGHLL